MESMICTQKKIMVSKKTFLKNNGFVKVNE